MSRFSSYIFFLASILLLTALYLLGLRLVDNAPGVIYLESLEIAQSDTGSIIGAPELFQRSGIRSAEEEHLLFRNSGAQWEFANVAWIKKVDARTNLRRTRFLKRWALREGDMLRIDNALLHVADAARDTLRIEDIADGRSVVWRDGLLVPSGEEFLYLDCRSWWWRQKFRLRWRLKNLENQIEISLFSIGGGVNCPDRWRIEGLPPHSAKILWSAGRFWLAPGHSNVPILMARANGEPKTYAELMFPATGDEGVIERLVIGRTYYDVETEPDAIRLTPIYGYDVWPANETGSYPSNKAVSPRYKTANWIGAGLSPAAWLQKHTLVIAVTGLLAALISLVIGMRHYIVVKQRKRAAQPLAFKLAVIFPATAGGLLSIFVWRIGDLGTESLLQMTWFAWLWATLLLAWKKRLNGLAGGIWLCALFFAGTGTIALTQLGAGADNTHWLTFARKHIFLLMGFGWFVALLNVVPVDRLREACLKWVGERAFFWRVIVRTALPICAVLVIIAQFFFGSEQGLWGIQPAEAAKLLYVVMAGFVGMHLGELRFKNTKLYQANPTKFVWDILKIFLLVGIALLTVLVGVRDISPLLIMLVVALAWQWRVAPHPWQTTPAYLANRGGVLLVTAIVLACFWWIYNYPANLPHWVPQWDRFMVWSQPEKFPHSGAQVLKSSHLVGRGGWMGADDSWFGSNGDALKLPSVQNDFILSFWFYKFGGLAGMLLAFVQIAYVWMQLKLSTKAAAWAEMSGHYMRREAGNVLSLIIFGLSIVHLTQWAISWGNTLRLLPVMGQPMTWISAANSHMIFIGLPTLVVGMTVGWIVDQKEYRAFV